MEEQVLVELRPALDEDLQQERDERDQPDAERHEEKRAESAPLAPVGIGSVADAPGAVARAEVGSEAVRAAHS